jgi:hypothetical protein
MISIMLELVCHNCRTLLDGYVAADEIQVQPCPRCYSVIEEDRVAMRRQAFQEGFITGAQEPTMPKPIKDKEGEQKNGNETPD